MRHTTFSWTYLTVAAIAFLCGASLARYPAINHVSHATDHHPPPAGEQFDEGPVLVRLPPQHLAPTRFIF